MRLVNFGPGEIADRLTILALKILVGTEKGKDVAHFKAEQAVLLAQIRTRSSLNGIWFEQVLELGAVNGQLWRAEDELRSKRSYFDAKPTPWNNDDTDDVMTIAFRIQALNDRRAQLVHQINTLTGDTNGQEKL